MAAPTRGRLVLRYDPPSSIPSHSQPSANLSCHLPAQPPDDLTLQRHLSSAAGDGHGFYDISYHAPNEPLVSTSLIRPTVSNILAPPPTVVLPTGSEYPPLRLYTSASGLLTANSSSLVPPQLPYSNTPGLNPTAPIMTPTLHHFASAPTTPWIPTPGQGHPMRPPALTNMAPITNGYPPSLVPFHMIPPNVNHPHNLFVPSSIVPFVRPINTVQPVESSLLPPPIVPSSHAGSSNTAANNPLKLVTNASIEESTTKEFNGHINTATPVSQHLSLTCVEDLETHSDYTVPVANKLPAKVPDIIEVQQSEYKTSPLISEHPIINQNPRKYTLKTHNISDPLMGVPNLSQDFISHWRKIKSDTTLSSTSNQPTILAWVLLLEEHLLHYMPFPVKKAIQPRYQPLNFKERFVNDSGLIALNNEVWNSLAQKRQTILILEGWSDWLNSYEISDHQFLLTKNIQRLLFTSLRQLSFDHLQHLEVAIIGPVPKWGLKNLKQAPEFSLSLARRLALTVMASVSWTYYNPCGLMEEVNTLNRKTSTKPFLLHDSDQIISKQFATLLETSFAGLICRIILGNKPEDSWQSKLKQNPQLPNPSDIYDCNLEKQGLRLSKHGFSTTTLSTPLPCHARHDHHPLCPPTQLGKHHGSEDDKHCLAGPDRLDHLPVVKDHRGHRQEHPTPQRQRLLHRKQRPRPSPPASSDTVSTDLQSKSTTTAPHIRKRREGSVHSRSDASESKPSGQSNKTKYRERHTATFSDSDSPDGPRRKYPRYDNYNPLSEMQRNGNPIPPPISRSQPVRNPTYPNGKLPGPSPNQRTTRTTTSSSWNQTRQRYTDRNQQRHENQRGRSPPQLLDLTSNDQHPHIKPRFRNNINHQNNHFNNRDYDKRKWDTFQKWGRQTTY